MNASKETRPIGIAILSWLHMISGIFGFFIFILLILLFRNNPEAQNLLSSIGIPPVLLIVAILFILVMTLVSGIGMWKGKKWGWILGSFNYLYEVVRNLYALIMIPAISSMFSAEDLSEAARGPAFYYVKYGGRAIIAGLIYLYFFKGSVRLYFGLFDIKKWKPVLAQIGVCLLIVVSFSIASKFLTAAEQEIVVLDSLYNKGDYEQVVDDGTKYVETHPQAFKAWSLMGWAYMELEEPNSARVCFQKSIEINPKWDNAYVGMGALCNEEDDLTGARSYFQQAIDLVPNNAEAYSSLVSIELQEKNDAKAVEYGEKAWSIRKDNPTIAANLAIAYHYYGDTKKRDIFFNHAKRLGYDDISTLQDIFDGKISLR